MVRHPVPETAALEAQRQEERAKARAEAEAREAEENLRAKMALFPESDDDQLMDNFLADLSADDEPLQGESGPVDKTPEPVRTGPPPSTNSILSSMWNNVMFSGQETHSKGCSLRCLES